MNEQNARRCMGIKKKRIKGRNSEEGESVSGGGGKKRERNKFIDKNIN